jgi:hypothetical protein
LEIGAIGHLANFTAKGIHFAGELRFCRSADSGVARLPGDFIEIESEKEGAATEASSSEGRFATGVAGADYHDVKFVLKLGHVDFFSKRVVISVFIIVKWKWCPGASQFCQNPKIKRF